MAIPVVSVRGEVSRDVEPEIARFSVTISARDRQRQVTLTRLTERAAALRTTLDGYGEAIEKRETSGIYVRPEPTKKRGEAISGYTGSLTTTVTVSDFGILGELVLALADQDQTVLAGPWWALRQTSPAYEEARRDAVTDAIARARTYADALGATLTGLIELSDDGLMGGGGGPQAMAFGVRSGSIGSSGGYAPELQLDPQRQTVTAQVQARFEISPPTVFG